LKVKLNLQAEARGCPIVTPASNASKTRCPTLVAVNNHFFIILVEETAAKEERE
jgi:Holliday junction resolvase